jgi:RNA polymerase sigma factor (sigma-70 family)
VGHAGVVRASIEHPQLFEAVFEAHHGTIWRYIARSAGREHADELASEVFLVAFAGRDKYDPERGSVAAWLYGIAANLLRTRLRREARRARAFRRAAQQQLELVSPIAALEDRMHTVENLAAVLDELARLSSRDREIIVMFAWERLSYEDIAAALGIEIGTVRSRLSRARAHLRELVNTTGEIDDVRARLREST